MFNKVMILRLLLVLCVIQSAFAASSASEHVFDGTMPPLIYTNSKGTFEAVKFDPSNATHVEWAKIIDADSASNAYCTTSMMQPRFNTEKAAAIGYTGYFHASSENPFGDYFVVLNSAPVACFTVDLPRGFMEEVKLIEAWEVLGLDAGNCEESKEEKPELIKESGAPLHWETWEYLQPHLKSAIEAARVNEALRFHAPLTGYVLKRFRQGMGKVLGALIGQIGGCMVGKQFNMPHYDVVKECFTYSLTPAFAGFGSEIDVANMPSLASHDLGENSISLKSWGEGKKMWVVISPANDTLLPVSHREIARTVIAMEKVHQVSKAAAGATANATAAASAGSAGSESASAGVGAGAGSSVERHV